MKDGTQALYDASAKDWAKDNAQNSSMLPILEDFASAQLLLVFKQGSSLDETASLKHYLGKDFFRPVYLYRIEDLCKTCEDRFSFLREIPSNDTAWKNIVLKRT